MIPSAVFVPAVVALQTKSSLSRKFLRNLGGMPKMSTLVLSNARKHTTGFFVKIFGECCRSTVLTATCYWPSSYCIPTQKCVRVGRVKSRPFAGGVGLRQGCVLPRSFSYTTSAVGTYLLSRAAKIADYRCQAANNN